MLFKGHLWKEHHTHKTQDTDSCSYKKALSSKPTSIARLITSMRFTQLCGLLGLWQRLLTCLLQCLPNLAPEKVSEHGGCCLSRMLPAALKGP
eukprot:2434918-Amphidinium_carterae.1